MMIKKTASGIRTTMPTIERLDKFKHRHELKSREAAIIKALDDSEKLEQFIADEKRRQDYIQAQKQE
jgi:hypothetical protein